MRPLSSGTDRPLMDAVRAGVLVVDGAMGGQLYERGARSEGVAIAREMLAAVRGRVAGAYVMPPFERYELALEVIDGFTDPR
jgi:hypothetical protein